MIFQWCRTARETLHDPGVRWVAVRESVLGPKSRHVSQLLGELEVLRHQMFAALLEQRDTLEPQMQTILDTVLAIRNERVELADETLDDLEERFLKVLDESRKEQAKSCFAYLREAMRDLPPGVAASLRASMLGGAL